MPDDHELLEAWRGGDAAAGRELFRRHFDSVYWFFCNKIDSGADDLAQETFLAIVRHRESVAQRASFRTYLFTVARRKLFDALRARAPARAVDPMASSIADLGLSPSRVIDGRREQVQLLAALRQLPIDLQVLLELRYFEQLRSIELAEILEVPHGTVRSRLRRALELLRTHLADAAELGDASDADFERWAQQLREGHGREPSAPP
jgi:RNA polymerase sigma-70 factor (ECF subfamily)